MQSFLPLRQLRDVVVPSLSAVARMGCLAGDTVSALPTHGRQKKVCLFMKTVLKKIKQN